jgi:dienelactone hydrolase
LSIHDPDHDAAGGVVVIQEAFGVTEHIEDVCERLARVGWLAVAPHLFHRTGDPVLSYGDLDQVMPHTRALTADEILADVDAVLGYLEDAGSPTYHRAAALDAWQRTLDWFARHLTTGATDTT